MRGALRPLTILTRPGSIFEPGLDRIRRGRQSRDLDAHRRCGLPRDGERDPGTAVGGRRRRPSGMCSSPSRGGRLLEMLYEVHAGGEGARHDRAGCAGDPRASDQHLQHAGRGHRGQLRYPRRAAGDPLGLRRGRRLSGGDGVVRSLPHARADDASDQLCRAQDHPPFGLQGGAHGKTARSLLTRAAR